jgi:hypothetical protein
LHGGHGCGTILGSGTLIRFWINFRDGGPARVNPQALGGTAESVS